ncbi:alanine--tRNA ligase-related protein [Spiroplasma melliferum]|uniref:alanine--tRNA ligase-related protein n=1 Tax=Spiroplasma melliferum TaxID=2134 RepID=UPI0002A64BE4|nr:alanine--tRNA ligase-related protein [Spiroplasma melliferum]ELL44330.1 alanyl-tRNA synthetase [Spiroplasma melliferum IPMB4A]
MTNEQIELLWTTFKKQENNVNLPPTTFHGYDQTTDTATVLALFDANGYPVTTLNGIGFIAFDHTVFYALGGGQISDTGVLIKKEHKISVFDLNKQIYKKVYLHLVDTNGTTIEINDVLIQKIDVERRIKITKNHTAQHILSYIIEHILNDGDMTDSVQIKTDYAFLAMNKVDNWLEIILKARKQIIEKLINHDIAKIEHQMPIAQARELKIAHPNFEYDPIVRVVEFPTATIDLCGGTHVNNLQEINFFEIWDCWVDKKKVRIQFSTNKEATQSYFTNWINQKKDNLSQSIKKIKNYDAEFNFTIPNFVIPTTILAKNNLNIEIEQLEKQLNGIAKEKYKLLLQTIDNTVFPIKEININNNLIIKEIIINDEKITLELIRNKLNKFLQEYENNLLIFINSTLQYGFIGFTKKHQSKFNLNNFLQTNKNAFAMAGGGTALFISFTFQNDIKPFLDLLIVTIKKAEMD